MNNCGYFKYFKIYSSFKNVKRCWKVYITCDITVSNSNNKLLIVNYHYDSNITTILLSKIIGQ